MNKKKQPLFFAILIINHLVGLVGLNSPHAADFELLSWINLVISFAFILSFQQPLDGKLGVFAGLTFLLGMAVEILGITTGFPFGEYHYTQQFGPMAFNVPLIIGINWILLTYCTASIFSRYAISPWFKILFAASLMTALDLLLEPFSIRHNFWVWANGTPPVQNFISWWVVAVFMQWMLHQFAVTVDSAIARWYVVLLALFLLADYLLHHFGLNIIEPFS